MTCGQVEDFAVDSWQEQQFILELHNRARWEVGSGRVHRGSPGPQPPATDMSALVRTSFDPKKKKAGKRIRKMSFLWKMEILTGQTSPFVIPILIEQ